MRRPVPIVVRQHAEDSAILRHVRSVLVRAPHVKLLHVKRHDERIAAHLDGLWVAGGDGAARCAEALENPGVGAVFAAAHCAIEARDQQALDRLFALAGAVPDAKRGLASAFGWASASQLQGTAKSLLESSDALRREIGIGACRLHRVDPGLALLAALADPSPSLRAASLHTAAALGRVDLLGAARSALRDEHPGVHYEAACAATLLGDRGASLDAHEAAARSDAPLPPASLALVVTATPFDRAHTFVRSLGKTAADAPAEQRRLIRAIGLHGDARFVPWLIERMADAHLARLAGEAFSFITGADLAWLDLERKPPEAVEAGPNDDAGDDNVALDEDESLPWPDQAAVHAWWQREAQRFQPGVRHLAGAPPSPEHCNAILVSGFQRQRIAAALTLCLLRPGAVLFNVAAPAWRQERLLASAAATG